MTILNILSHPNPILNTKAEEITEITANIKQLANDMLETMYDAPGIGLAANQVGVLKRIIVVDLQENETKSPIILINPVITKKSTELFECEEGCLSLMPMKAITKRPKEIEVSYTDIHGIKQNITATDLLSVCIQHEVDHLNGILFVSQLSKLKRDILLRRYRKLQNSNKAEENNP